MGEIGRSRYDRRDSLCFKIMESAINNPWEFYVIFFCLPITDTIYSNESRWGQSFGKPHLD
jgi:hypothetical protein